MEIKDIQGNILIDALVTESAVKTEELMKQDSITLSWKAITAEELPVGSYVIHNGVRYSLLSPYRPQQLDEVAFEYRPEFHHPVMRWQHLPFFFYSNGTKETDWSLTDNPANFMSAVCEAISQETGENWSYSIASNLNASASLSFSNTDIFSALNSIASAFETEWWFDYANKELHLSKAGFGSAVTLEVGKNISVPSATESKEGYATRFYVFGSTRNIDQKYNGSNVNSVVNRRLTLNPAKYPNGYIDIREGLTNEEVLVKTLVFDDIYPRSSLTISDVRVRLMWRLDDDNKKVPVGTGADGKPVYDQYAIWYFKIPNLSFNKDMVISGKALSVHFNNGPLSGREFELTPHSEEKALENSDGVDFTVEKGDFEINFIEESTYIIPSITGLTPVDGNSITLFNIVMPEEYKTSAYDELEDAAMTVISEQSEDLNNYSFESNPVEFYKNNPNLSIGSNVSFKSQGYSYNTRVIKLETQLDRPFEQRITIGNQKIKGNTQELKEEVVNVNQNVDLLAAINESTTAFQQVLQRSQKLMQEYMTVSLFERVNVGTEENPKYAIRPVKYKDEPVGILSDTFITAKGINEDEEGPLFTVVTDWTQYEGDPNEVLSSILGYELKGRIEALENKGGGSGGTIDESVLKDYLKKDEAALRYTPLSSFNELNTKVTDFLEGSDTDTIINKWKELEAFLAGQTESSTLADLLSIKADKQTVVDLQNYLNKLFTAELDGNGNLVSIKANAGLWTEQYITAKGINGNIEGDLFVRLDRWEDYNADEGQVLSAKLGYELLQMINNGSGGGGSSEDLSDYVKKDELNTRLGSYVTSASLTTTLSGYQTKITTSNKIPYDCISGTPTIPSTSSFLSINGGTINGNLRLQKANQNYGSYLYFGDSSYAYIAEITDDDLTIKATDININGNLYINGVAYSGGSSVDLSSYATKDWVTNTALDGYATTSDLSSYLPKTGNTGISGSLGVGQSSYNSSYKLYVNGSFYASSVTHGSDIRYKSVLQDVAEDIEVIANAPVFDFDWTNNELPTQLGTSAQYWLDTKFSNAVNYDKDKDFYGLAYGELGVAIGVINSRKLVNHESRLSVVEKMLGIKQEV